MRGWVVRINHLLRRFGFPLLCPWELCKTFQSISPPQPSCCRLYQANGVRCYQLVGLCLLLEEGGLLSDREGKISQHRCIHHRDCRQCIHFLLQGLCCLNFSNEKMLALGSHLEQFLDCEVDFHVLKCLPGLLHVFKHFLFFLREFIWTTRGMLGHSSVCCC